MATEIRVPTLGESVTEATIAQWFKKAGEQVAADEPLVELETDKVTVEVPAPAAGVLAEITVEAGETVEVGTLLGSLSEGGDAKAIDSGPETPRRKPAPAGEAKPSAEAPEKGEKPAPKAGSREAAADAPLAPSVRRLAEETGIDPARVDGTGKGGRVTKGDMLAAAENRAAPAREAREERPRPAPTPVMRAPSAPDDASREERVKMTRLRQTIARRLKDAQDAAAMLTTFNDVDMSAVMELRRRYKDVFEKKHGQKLGFMGFFLKAVIQALRDVPAVNAEIDGTDIVYKNYYHIGVAVGTDRGLVVPVVRDADAKSLPEIEAEISGFGRRAREGQIKIEEMQGGTFTITNGGVYGSLMSTPILNAPQSGILGMHRIDERPVAVDGEIVIRPMMYLALSYDHRLVDGREAVTFLVRVKESIENPERLMLDL